MICGMVIWLTQRSMAMNERLNERLLEVRMEEAKKAIETGAPDVAADPQVKALQQQLQSVEAAMKREAEARRKAEAQMATLLEREQQTKAKPKPVAKKPAPKPVVKQKPAPQKPTAKPAPAQPKPQAAQPKQQAAPQQAQAPVAPTRKAPTETKASAARVGADGYPINRITLPMGNDELDWQL
jgi:D-alanyl-D-alanine carboxypeptidase